MSKLEAQEADVDSMRSSDLARVEHMSRRGSARTSRCSETSSSRAVGCSAQGAPEQVHKMKGFEYSFRGRIIDKGASDNWGEPCQ